MNHELNIEELLHRAPQPAPSADLLTDLERQIHLPQNPEPKRCSAFLELLRRFWIPATSLAAATVLVVVSLSFWNLGTTRTLAQSVAALARVKSFHVIERVRSGPGKPVIKDKSNRSMDWPNYHTSIHPGNPFEETQHWFQADPRTPTQGKTRTSRPQVEIWRNGNVVLEVNRATGDRKMTLNSSQTMFAGIAQPIVGGQTTRFSEVVKSAPGLTPELAAAVWVGEFRWKMNDAEQIMRVWLNRTNNLPVRVQHWATEFPEFGPEVLLQEWEFSDFDAYLPEDTFAFDITDADLAPLEINTGELAKLPATALSIHLTGETGAEIVGTLKDDGGVREVKGRLPFSFVHNRVGDLKYEFRMAEGQKRGIGIAVNGSNMSTEAVGIRGELTATSASMEGIP